MEKFMRKRQMKLIFKKEKERQETLLQKMDDEEMQKNAINEAKIFQKERMAEAKKENERVKQITERSLSYE